VAPPAEKRKACGVGALSSRVQHGVLLRAPTGENEALELVEMILFDCERIRLHRCIMFVMYVMFV